MAITFIGAGAHATGTTTLTLELPSGVQDGDFLLAVIHTANNDVGLAATYEWNSLTPVSTGNANSAGGVRLSIFHKFYKKETAAFASFTITSGTVTNGRMYAFRGVDKSSPFDTPPITYVQSAASTTLVWQSITPITNNAMIVLAAALDRDTSSTTTTSSYVNPNLSDLTERQDQTVNTSTGGGTVVATATKAIAGATGTTAATVLSTIYVTMTIALRPEPPYVILSTDAAGPVLDDSVTFNGTISSDNGNTITKRGFVYATSSKPLPAHTYPPGSTQYSNYYEETGTFTVGSFSYTLSSLSPNSIYYFRAYAYSSVGYTYGEEFSVVVKGFLFLSDSSNISSGASSSTTPRLTPPSGKTTSNFVSGKIADDKNPIPTIIPFTIAGDEYTEIEWSIAISDLAGNGDEFELKVISSGRGIPNVLQTPVITIGAAGESASSSESVSSSDSFLATKLTASSANESTVSSSESSSSKTTQSGIADSPSVVDATNRNIVCSVYGNDSFSTQDNGIATTFKLSTSVENNSLTDFLSGIAHQLASTIDSDSIIEMVSAVAFAFSTNIESTTITSQASSGIIAFSGIEEDTNASEIPFGVKVTETGSIEISIGGESLTALMRGEAASTDISIVGTMESANMFAFSNLVESFASSEFVSSILHTISQIVDSATFQDSINCSPLKLTDAEDSNNSTDSQSSDSSTSSANSDTLSMSDLGDSVKNSSTSILDGAQISESVSLSKLSDSAIEELSSTEASQIPSKWTDTTIEDSLSPIDFNATESATGTSAIDFHLLSDSVLAISNGKAIVVDSVLIDDAESARMDAMSNYAESLLLGDSSAGSSIIETTTQEDFQLVDGSASTIAILEEIEEHFFINDSISSISSSVVISVDLGVIDETITSVSEGGLSVLHDSIEFSEYLNTSTVKPSATLDISYAVDGMLSSSLSLGARNDISNTTDALSSASKLVGSMSEVSSIEGETLAEKFIGVQNADTIVLSDAVGDVLRVSYSELIDSLTTNEYLVAVKATEVICGTVSSILDSSTSEKETSSNAVETSAIVEVLHSVKNTLAELSSDSIIVTDDYISVVIPKGGFIETIVIGLQTGTIQIGCLKGSISIGLKTGSATIDCLQGSISIGCETGTIETE